MLRKTLACLVLLFVASASIDAQIKPVYDQGALGLMQLLKRLNTTASALMIGAHPDDEDTALLAYLARGESARTAYLSLTRGDGGQNIIGPELGEALGVIRTEELLQARKLDGAEQYFTRAYDYGFSKTLAEAKQKWDEKIILCDVVRVIRAFRPMVVISVFNGTPQDGHGQHQYAGYISSLAIKAAADPAQCNADGPIWQVSKFYVRHRGAGEPTLRINTGKYDPLLGRSYFEIAMEARSQHKSQEQGVLELKGGQFSSLNLVNDGSVSTEREKGIFDRLDTSINRIASLNEKLPASVPRVSIAEISDLITQLQSESVSARRSETALILIQLQEKLWEKLRVLRAQCANEMGAIPGCPPVTHAEVSALEEVRSHFGNLLANVARTIPKALGIQVDALVDRETAVLGEEFQIAVRVFVPEPERIRINKISVSSYGLEIKEAAGPIGTGRNTRVETATRSAFYTARYIGGYDGDVTTPQWLLTPRKGALFSSTIPSRFGLPFDGYHAFSAEVSLSIDGKPVGINQPLEYRYADDVRGEIRRKLNIAPKVSVELDQSLVIAPLSVKPVDRELTVTVESNSVRPVSGTASVKVPSGWGVRPTVQQIEVPERGRKVSAKFVVTIPAKVVPGSYDLAAEAVVDGGRFARSMKTIAYPHIQTHRYYRDASAQVKVVDLRIRPTKVGYIKGSGDRLPEAINQIGLPVTEIDDALLATGNLSTFDTIVVGIRAYQVRLDLVANNKRLLDFANNGGNLVVLYQLPGYTQQNLAPFPAQQGPRVADENAKVTILNPDHSIFNVPNKITEKDFDGWVQERNLYNFSTMDEKYTGLLESHDAGEAENRGGLVVAEVGKGRYIYCSYSLFRQLPAGVPGAYRLLANLLNFSKPKK